MPRCTALEKGGFYGPDEPRGNHVRIASLHPLLRDRPGRALEIDRIPDGLDQLALTHQGQQNHMQRQSDGRIGRHRFHLLHRQSDCQRRQGAILRYEGGDRCRSHAVGRVVHLFAVGDGVDIDLLHDIPNLDRGGEHPAFLDLVAQGSQVFGLDLRQQAILENREDVRVDDVLAHGAHAVSQPCVGQPGVHRCAEGLDGDHPTFLTLLFQCGRDALEHGFARAIASEMPPGP